MADTTATRPAYIPQGTRSKCSCGSDEGLLNLSPDHGVVYTPSQEPLLNANDHIPGVNIPKYGFCSGLWDLNACAIPVVLLGELLVSKVTTGHCGTLCSPVTPKVWIDVNKKHLLDGAPALTEKSKLTCVRGGVITILPVEKNKSQTSDNSQSNAGQSQTGDNGQGNAIK